MKILELLPKQMEKELEDAEEYSRMAIEWKDECPEVAEEFAKLSKDEVDHSDRLHNIAVRKIKQLKEAGKVPTEKMQGVYDYLHEHNIKHAEKVADLQRLYSK